MAGPISYRLMRDELKSIGYVPFTAFDVGGGFGQGTYNHAARFNYALSELGTEHGLYIPGCVSGQNNMWTVGESIVLPVDRPTIRGGGMRSGIRALPGMSEAIIRGNATSYVSYALIQDILLDGGWDGLPTSGSIDCHGIDLSLSNQVFTSQTPLNTVDARNAIRGVQIANVRGHGIKLVGRGENDVSNFKIIKVGLDGVYCDSFDNNFVSGHIGATGFAGMRFAKTFGADNGVIGVKLWYNGELSSKDVRITEAMLTAFPGIANLGYRAAGVDYPHSDGVNPDHTHRLGNTSEAMKREIERMMLGYQQRWTEVRNGNHASDVYKHDIPDGMWPNTAPGAPSYGDNPATQYDFNTQHTAYGANHPTSGLPWDGFIEGAGIICLGNDNHIAGSRCQDAGGASLYVEGKRNNIEMMITQGSDRLRKWYNKQPWVWLGSNQIAGTTGMQAEDNYIEVNIREPGDPLPVSYGAIRLQTTGNVPRRNTIKVRKFNPTGPKTFVGTGKVVKDVLGYNPAQGNRIEIDGTTWTEDTTSAATWEV